MSKKVLSLDQLRFHRFKKGDERAFEHYFKAYFNEIVGFSMQFLRDEDKSRSIAQEAFIKLWKNREKVEKLNGIKAFLCTSAKSDCISLLRHKKVVDRYKNSTLDQRERDLNMDVLNALEFDTMSFNELEDLITESIESLPEKCKMIFNKRRRDNKKNKEIAEELGITVKAVEANMTRALKILRVKLANYLPSFL